MQKVPCHKCGAQILPATAAKNDGLCAPCKSGIRESIEKSKAYYQKQRELDRTDPQRLYWKTLVNRVHGEGASFDNLSKAEQRYFAVTILISEVHNGGFEQFFYNSSGDYYVIVSEFLLEVGAQNSLRLLREAKEILFLGAVVPLATSARRDFLASHLILEAHHIDGLDKAFCADPDGLDEKLRTYAVSNNLFEPGGETAHGF